MKDILRSLRNKNNYSQSAVASYLEISRQMYNKYENGSSEPSLKNIKKLCELYKVSADVFFQKKKDDEIQTDLYKENTESSSAIYVASPSVTYRSSVELSENKPGLFDELVKILPHLRLNEQISLMSKLSALIENEICVKESSSEKLAIKQKKIKKIPDYEYNKYLKSDESKKINKSSLANIREILKNDVW